jgi:hypothetical protein
LKEPKIFAERIAVTRTMFQIGDHIICRVTKHASRPSPFAMQVAPSAKGDSYSFVVDKYWIVVGLEPGQSLRVRTRRGKEFQVNLTDPRLRRASWWERICFRNRFP